MVQRVRRPPPTCQQLLLPPARFALLLSARNVKTNYLSGGDETAPTTRETLCTNGFVIQRKDGKPSSDSHVVTTKNAARSGQPRSGLSGSGRKVSVFKYTGMQGWHIFPPKKGVQNGRSGGREEKKQVGQFRRIFTPTFKKKTSHITIRSVVQDLAYSIFGCKSIYRPWTWKKISVPKKP